MEYIVRFLWYNYSKAEVVNVAKTFNFRTATRKRQRLVINVSAVNEFWSIYDVLWTWNKLELLFTSKMQAFEQFRAIFWLFWMQMPNYSFRRPEVMWYNFEAFSPKIILPIEFILMKKHGKICFLPKDFIFLSYFPNY
jgi:hypothetical protein